MARVWLFSCVSSDVSGEICRARKRFPTKSTLVSSKGRGGRKGGGESRLVQLEGREPRRAGEGQGACWLRSDNGYWGVLVGMTRGHHEGGGIEGAER